MNKLMIAVLLSVTVSFGNLITTYTDQYGTHTNQYIIRNGQKINLHNTHQWQSLGEEFINDGLAPVNNGIMWSTDGGQTWGHDEVSVNETVTFKITAFKEYQGTHTFDALKVWIDDKEVYQNYLNLEDNGNKKSLTVNGQTYYTSYYYDDVTTVRSYSCTFTTSFGEEDVGDLDLVGRVVCSDDLADMYNDGDGGKQNKWIQYIDENNHIQWKQKDLVTQNDWNAWKVDNPIASYKQGEVEKYVLTVKNVPEPTMVSLLGFGLLGLFALRRRK